MNQSFLSSLKWGVIIGLANLTWLYAAFYLGLHTSGILIFQVFMLIWLAITVVGFIFALLSIRRKSEAWTYLRGLYLGSLVALVSALFAVIAQIGYFTVIHPQWPEVMAGQAKDHFKSQGLSDAELLQKVDEAKEFFTLTNYATQSAISALILGILLTAILMIFLRRPINQK